MAKQPTPKPKKVSVSDTKSRISRATDFGHYQNDRSLQLKAKSDTIKDVKKKAKLDSLSSVSSAASNAAFKIADQQSGVLSRGLSKRAKESAVVQKKVSSTLFKSSKPSKPSVLKKK